ncbi:M55 family metallopeptidase [Paracoccus lutimaris]|uniref:M55 family metallopeptidase n=1 Tax=Paracoccus lutimaris TaxID=1490030 RepID=UPI001FE8DD9B|nr:M55 family metallopeptidase [Paracoccus lutimaris]
MNMVCGLEGNVDLTVMLGHHSMAGRGGVLAHTTNCLAFREVRVNGQPCGEPAIYGLYAGKLGVPVGLILGDDCSWDRKLPLFPQAEFATVKQAQGQRPARELSCPARADKACWTALAWGRTTARSARAWRSTVSVCTAISRCAGQPAAGMPFFLPKWRR